MFHYYGAGGCALAVALSAGLAGAVGVAQAVPQTGVNADVGFGNPHYLSTSTSPPTKTNPAGGASTASPSVGGGPNAGDVNPNEQQIEPSQGMGAGPGVGDRVNVPSTPGVSPNGESEPVPNAGGPMEEARPNLSSTPMYFITDASIFTANALSAMAGLSHEHALAPSVPEPGVLEGQAQVVVMSTGRALNSLEALQQNAERHNPQAVPAIREAIANLVIAQAQARSAVMAIRAGRYGADYGSALRTALSELENANVSIARVGHAYGLPYEHGEMIQPSVRRTAPPAGANEVEPGVPPAQGGGPPPKDEPKRAY